MLLPQGAGATRSAKTVYAAAGQSGTMRTKATPQHHDTWTGVGQMQATAVVGRLL